MPSPSSSPYVIYFSTQQIIKIYLEIFQRMKIFKKYGQGKRSVKEIKKLIRQEYKQGKNKKIIIIYYLFIY